MSILNLVRRPRPRYTGPIGSNGAGMLVTHDTALSHTTVWSCVRYIGETVAGLDWSVVQTAKGGRREQIVGGAVDWMLNKQANPEMTAVTWRETVLTHVLLTGNHYSEIQRDVMGRPLWLWPLMPQTVRMYRDDNNDLKYAVWQENGPEAILDARDVFHVKGLTWDGVAGYSVVTVARRCIGIGLAMDEYAANFYRNGTHVGLIFEHPKTMSEKAQENFKRSLKENYSGPGLAFKPIVTEEGMKLTKAGMSMVDAQFLQQRDLNGVEICGWFRVPPHKVGKLERATNNNIEHQSIEAVQDCIRPWCTKLEQEADIKLFGVSGQRVMSTELDTDSLERGDLKSRYDALKVGRDGGWFSVNDVLTILKRNHIGPEGDMRLQPMNMVPLGTEPPEEPADIPGAPDNEGSGDATNKVVQMRERLQKRIGHG